MAPFSTLSAVPSNNAVTGMSNERLIESQGNTPMRGSPMTATQIADTAAVPFDPFELKDVVSGNIRDPYPRMHELRRQASVHSGPVDLGDGLFPADPAKPPSVTVFGFDEVVQVLRDNETYSSGIYESVMGMV